MTDVSHGYKVGDKVIMLQDDWGCLKGKTYTIEQIDTREQDFMNHKLRNESGSLLWVDRHSFEHVSECYKCIHACKLDEVCPLFEESTPPPVEED